MAGNGIAVVLEQRPGRSADETDAMVAAAEAALVNWRRAGGWIEEERAEYRLARSLLQAGRGREADVHAERCLRICERESAPAFELFFAQAIVATTRQAVGDRAGSAAARARSLAVHAALDDADRSACAENLAALEALDGAT